MATTTTTNTTSTTANGNGSSSSTNATSALIRPSHVYYNMRLLFLWLCFESKLIWNFHILNSFRQSRQMQNVFALSFFRSMFAPNLEITCSYCFRVDRLAWVNQKLHLSNSNWLFTHTLLLIKLKNVYVCFTNFDTIIKRCLVVSRIQKCF